MADARPRVVVVGAGFGGLWAARQMVGKGVDVTLVDRNNYHTFFPLLYQVAAAELVPTDIAYPIRSIFRRAKNVDVLLAEMTGLDTEAKEVLTDRAALPYDALVLALGSEVTYFGVPGAAEHAFPLRWMADAIPLRHHVLTRFEAAGRTEGDRRRALLTFAIVGGGPTGVEYAGALAELINGPLLRDFPRIGAHECRIVILEGGDRLLNGMPERLVDYAHKRLENRGVRIRYGAMVQRVDDGGVVLSDGDRVESDSVVWTAGVRGEPRAEAWGLPVGRGGRVSVKPDLSVSGLDGVFAIGDLAYQESEDGEAHPQVAQVAIQQGIRAGRNVLAALDGRETTPFRYRDPGMLAVIGRNAAVAHIFGRAFTGFTAWVLWLAIHISWLIGFRNRALVLVNWGWNYVFFRRAVRLILPTVTVPAEAPPEKTLDP